MTCPNCGSEDVCVRETMQGTNGKVYRRRRCNQCSTIFRTVEDVMIDTERSRKDYSEAMKNKSPLIKAYYENENA